MAKKKNTIPDPDARFRSWFIVCPNILANGVCGLTAKDLEGMTPQEICDFVVTQWASATKQAACLYCISKSRDDSSAYCSVLNKWCKILYYQKVYRQ